MAFVCEYIPEEDVAKYRLKELWQEYGYDFPQKAEWVRDRERDLFLVRLGNLIPKNPDEDWIKHHEIRGMYWKRQMIIVRMMYSGQENLSQRPYNVKCIFVGFHHCHAYIPTNKELPEFIVQIKEALLVYGQAGMNSRVPHGEVMVTFSGFDVHRPTPDMTNMCEYISEEDIVRYRLKELWKSYGYDFPLKPEWVRDRKNNMYLVQIRGLSRENDYEIWSLHWKERNTGVQIFRSGDAYYSMRPYNISWSFIGFEGPFTIPTSDESYNFFSLLKQALTAYGQGGVNSIVPHNEVIISFNFVDIISSNSIINKY